MEFFFEKVKIFSPLLVKMYLQRFSNQLAIAPLPRLAMILILWVNQYTR